MVKRSPELDDVFGSLSDPVRRDILQRVSARALSVSEVAAPYEMSLAAVSKHLKVLESAGLVTKTRDGKRLLVKLAPEPLRQAQSYLDFYTSLAVQRMDSLAKYLEEEKDQ